MRRDGEVMKLEGRVRRLREADRAGRVTDACFCLRLAIDLVSHEESTPRMVAAAQRMTEAAELLLGEGVA